LGARTAVTKPRAKIPQSMQPMHESRSRVWTRHTRGGRLAGMARVLLADPPQMFLAGDGLVRHVQPLGLGYLGAVLAGRHDVRFLLPDIRAYRGADPWGELARAIVDESPDLLALTALTATFPAAARLAEVAKQVRPELVVVLGGTHASADPRYALGAAPQADYAVRGEGEGPIVAIADALSERRLDPATIPGLTWRTPDGGFASNPAATLDDLDAIPFPLRDPRYILWSEGLHPTFFQALITQRGCPYRCIYCAVPHSVDRRIRYRSPANVLGEIEQLRRDYAVPGLFFHDSVFSVHRERTLEICRGMTARRLALPFTCQTRTDRIDPELLDAMVAAGCEHVFFGIESGNLESLRRIRKGVPLDSVRGAVQLVKSRGIRCSGFFIVGFPWEDEAAIERTAEFATSLGLDAISLFSATPLPGTELWTLTGGYRMPASIDFRRPQVNLTRLSDDAYAELYQRVKARIDLHNEATMMARAHAGGLPRGGSFAPDS
jgi:anaerobic magnesium-protoporphyrin IX monomethyl ester cyclase